MKKNRGRSLLIGLLVMVAFLVGAESMSVLASITSNPQQGSLNQAAAVSVATTASTTTCFSGSISGVVFNDRKGDGIFSSCAAGAGPSTADNANCDPTLSHWGVFIDNAGTGVYDPSKDVRVFSDEWGRYAFTNLAPGVYRINEGIVSGWKRDVPGSSGYTIQIGTGVDGIQAGINFGSYQVSTTTNEPVYPFPTNVQP